MNSKIQNNHEIAKEKIDNYINNPLIFVKDLKNFGIKENFDTYFDLAQYFYHCNPSSCQDDVLREKLIRYYNKRFVIYKNWGYKSTYSRHIYYPNTMAHRPVSDIHIKKLEKFFNLDANDKTLIKSPRFCKTLIGWDDFFVCGKILEKNKQICNLCSKFNNNNRYYNRNREINMLPIIDNLIDRAPELVLLKKI